MLQGITIADAVARNNARVYSDARWKLRWIYRRAVPTGSYFPVYLEVPESAASFRLDYLLLYWPYPREGALVPIFVQAYDDRGQQFVFVDSRRPETSRGADVRLFTSPGMETDTVATADRAPYRGTYPLGLEFPGRAQLTLLFRIPTFAAGNPEFIDILLAGHVRNKVPE